MKTAPFLLEIAFPHREQDAREALELALAAAALELPLAVLFTGEGRSHLGFPESRPWRQLSDHGLASILYRGEPEGIDPALVAESVGPEREARLRAAARAILRL